METSVREIRCLSSSETSQGGRGGGGGLVGRGEGALNVTEFNGGVRIQKLQFDVQWFVHFGQPLKNVAIGRSRKLNHFPLNNNPHSGSQPITFLHMCHVFVLYKESTAFFFQPPHLYVFRTRTDSYAVQVVSIGERLTGQTGKIGHTCTRYFTSALVSALTSCAVF